MSGRPQPSLADYVAVALCPALIMALVGSLVFFLLEVLYVGRYEGRMQWILFFFVFAAVLIARISMTAGIAERAPLYGLALGVLVWIALARFVTFPPETALAEWSWAVYLGLIAVIWWCAHKLTWDCTLIDETVDASGAGLLRVAGLERNADAADETAEVDEGPAGNEDVPGGWWARYRLYRQRQARKPHAPGVWVVYFSLAALPLFGLGESLIPAGAAASRRYAFGLLAVYVASALGLLLTTSFLGLRRYLRQRKLRMPAAMTGVWLAIGAGLILALLGAAALLPRPYAEYAVINLGRAGSAEREASRWSAGGKDAGTGEGKPGSQGTQEGKGNAPGASKEGGGQGAGRHAGGQGRDQQGSGSDKGGQPQGNQPGSGQDKSGRDGAQGQTKGDSRSNSSGERPPPRPGEHAPNTDAKADSTRDDSPSSAPDGPSSLGSLFNGLLKLLKWIVFAALALVVGFFVVRAVLRFLANFTGWARGLLASLERLWQSLFGWMTPKETPAGDDEAEAGVLVPRPFASYRNPFEGGPGGSPEEIVRYSFEALEAWGYERGVGRSDDDTPLEFAERVAEEKPALAADARRLAALYARAAYARGRLPASATDSLRRFWDRLGA
jgi:hypothetical protein